MLEGGQTVLPSPLQITVQAIHWRGIQVEIAQGRGDALRIAQAKIADGSIVVGGTAGLWEGIRFHTCLSPLMRCWQSNYWVKNTTTLCKKPDRKTIAAEYYLTEVSAIAATGELVLAVPKGIALKRYPFPAAHVIFLATIKKIYPTLQEAMQRVRQTGFTHPKIKQKKVMMPTGTCLKEVLVFEKEPTPGRSTLILISE